MDTNQKCPHCGEESDLDLSACEDGDGVYCGTCSETSFVWVGRLVDGDTYHESLCDSEASARYEEAAYGRDD